MFKKVNISLIVIIIILVGFNVFLLSKDSNLENRVESLNSLVETQENQLSIMRQSQNIDTLSDDFLKLPGSDISLLVFFPTSSCSSCLIYEVQNFNNFYSKYQPRARAYVLGSDRSVLERSGAEFLFQTMAIKKFVMQTGINHTNPIALLVDSNGMVHDTYLAEVGNETKSNRFYERMRSLFETTE